MKKRTTNLNGFLLIDKPQGETSFKQLMVLRKRLNVKTMGFIGTLDPLATGLMIVAVGEYTKLIPLLEGLDKVYQVEIRLGATSNTDDVDGEVKEGHGYTVPEVQKIETIINTELTGKILQIPPKFSAIQIAGKRAYAMARKGEEFEIKPRLVEIYENKLLQYSFPSLQLMVHCSSGTYIRSIARDLGEQLGCGGVVAALRRLKIGQFSVDDALKVDEVDAGKLIDGLAFLNFHRVELLPAQWEFLAVGGEMRLVDFLLSRNDLEKPVLAVYQNKIVGVLELSSRGLVKFRRKLLL